MAIQYGMNDQSAAVKMTIARVLGGRSSVGRKRGKRRAKKAVKRAAKRVRKAGRKVKGKLRKGSAAMKRHMAKLRKMRRK